MPSTSQTSQSLRSTWQCASCSLCRGSGTFLCTLQRRCRPAGHCGGTYAHNCGHPREEGSVAENLSQRLPWLSDHSPNPMTTPPSIHSQPSYDLTLTTHDSQHHDSGAVAVVMTTPMCSLTSACLSIRLPAGATPNPCSRRSRAAWPTRSKAATVAGKSGMML